MKKVLSILILLFISIVFASYCYADTMTIRGKARVIDGDTIEVNGENQTELYKFLKSQQGFKGFTGVKGAVMKAVVSKIDPDYKNNPDIKWNFTKFIVDREGNVVSRLEPMAEMNEMEAVISKLI